jgi:phytoene dehydrogenase-like protein
VFALGIDKPTYFSVHSTWANLATPGHHVVHLMKYLPPTDDSGGADERDLEELLDRCQPGWRARVVERRFLPRMTVNGWLPLATGRGLAGRPGPVVPGVRNLFVAGDWVGAEGMLADGAFASGRQAAGLAASATVSAMGAGQPGSAWT